jgi:APA family basic amino acid/polyamine antiporter
MCTAISVKGISMSRLVNNGLVVMIIVSMLALTAAGALSPHRSAPTTSPVPLSAVAVLVPIFFTYSGWNAAAYMTAEFRHPARDVPRALIFGTGIVTLLYVGVNIATLRVFNLIPDAASASPVAAAARILLGSAGSTVIMLLALAALASSVCAMVITGPRIYEAMAKDGALPAKFVERTNGSPRAAILAQSTWTSILVVSGTFAQLVTYTGFAIVVFSALTVASLIVLRRREGAPSTFSVPLYPVTPVLFIVATIFIAISSFQYAPVPSMLGLALILIGLPLRRFARPILLRRQEAAS